VPSSFMRTKVPSRLILAEIDLLLMSVGPAGGNDAYVVVSFVLLEIRSVLAEVPLTRDRVLIEG
jgi:hypothetical protein